MKLIIYTALLTCAALPSLPGAASAQTAEAAGALETIVVTATRSRLPASALPVTVDIIDSAALAEQARFSGSVVDAVATLTPSFSPTREKLSGGGESLRGRAPLFAINGIPQTSPLRDGSRDGFTIDPFFIDRVELIYGSNALQGIGATGGIVNQVTVGPPAQDGWSGRVLAQATADNQLSGDGWGWKGAALAARRAGRFDATLGASYEKRGVYRDGEGRIVGFDGTQGETQDSTGWSLFGRVGLAVGDSGRLDLIANRFELAGDGDYVTVAGDRATGVPTSAVKGRQPGVAPVNKAELAALSYTDDDLGGGALVGQLFYSRTRDTYGGGVFVEFQDPLIDSDGDLFDQSQNRSRKLGAKLSYERDVPGLSGLSAIAGFDMLYDRTRQTLIATGRDWVPQTDYRSLAPFGQLNLALLGERLRLAGGLRLENVQITIPDYTTLAYYGRQQVGGGSPSFEAVLPNGGVILEPLKGMRFYASYAEGYTVPDVGRITRAIDTPGVDIDSYLDISPIISNNRELGIEVGRGPVQASASYFWSSSDKGQLLVLIDEVYEVQRQRIEIEGLELSLAYNTPLDGLTVSAAYSDLTGRADTNNDGIVDSDLDGANIAPDRINLAAAYSHDRLSARLQARMYLSRDFEGSARENSFEGYTLTDASVAYKTRVGTLSLSIANLFDVQYISYNSDTTRPSDNLRYFAGRGRTLTLGLDYRF